MPTTPISCHPPADNTILHRWTSLIRKRLPLGPYSRPEPRALRRSKGGGRFLMGEVPLYRWTKKVLES